MSLQHLPCELLEQVCSFLQNVEIATLLHALYPTKCFGMQYFDAQRKVVSLFICSYWAGAIELGPRIPVLFLGVEFIWSPEGISGVFDAPKSKKTERLLWENRHLVV